MLVRELIELLQAQDPDMEVVGLDEGPPFELTEVREGQWATGKRLPTERPGVYNLEYKTFVVVA